MIHSKFTIAYYQGQEEDRPELKTDHDSVNAAGRWAQVNYIPLSVIRITEWDINGEYDSHRNPQILGSCNLEEAFEENLETLPQ